MTVSPRPTETLTEAPSRRAIEQALLAFVWIAREHLGDAEAFAKPTERDEVDSRGSLTSLLCAERLLDGALALLGDDAWIDWSTEQWADDVRDACTQAKSGAANAMARARMYDTAANFAAGQTEDRLESKRVLWSRAAASARKHAHRAVFLLADHLRTT